MRNEAEIEKEFMLEAFAEARKAYYEDEVPVGAVVVRRGEIISRAHNKTEALKDASAHAELLALRLAAEKLGSWRLSDCVLYVTLEPCAMCMGAILNFRIAAIAFGAFDPVAGCCISRCELSNGMINVSIPYVGGIMEKECADLLGSYFSEKREGHGNVNKT